MFMGSRRKGIHPQGMIWRKTHSSQNYLPYQAYPRAKILSCVYRWFHLIYKNKHMCLLEGKHPLRPMVISYMASELSLRALVGSQEMELRRGRGWEEGKTSSGLSDSQEKAGSERHTMTRLSMGPQHFWHKDQTRVRRGHGVPAWKGEHHSEKVSLRARVYLCWTGLPSGGPAFSTSTKELAWVVVPPQYSSCENPSELSRVLKT